MTCKHEGKIRFRHGYDRGKNFRKETCADCGKVLKDEKWVEIPKEMGTLYEMRIKS